MLSSLRKRLSKKTIAQISLVGVVALAAVAYVIWDVCAKGPLTSFLSDQSAVDEWVKNLGPLAPLGFICLQILQTVLAPIPGAVTGLAGGYVFGWWGILWTVIGGAIGAAIVFWLSKRFGRPLIEKIFKPSAIEKFDFIAGKHAGVILFLIFLLPCFPDDMVCYLGGLTELPIKKLMILVVLGHLPSIAVTNYMGMNIGENSLIPVIIAALVVVLLFGVVYYFRESITAKLKALGEKSKM